jgi:hypothetical protein
VFFLLFLLTVCGCNSSLNQKPEADVNAVISPVDSQEFESLGGLSAISKPVQKDFKKFTLSVKIRNDEQLVYKNIGVPDISQFKKAINSMKDSNIQGKRYWFGEYSGGGNSDYNAEIIFFARGLLEVDFEAAFNDLEIYVETETRDKEHNKAVFIISEKLLLKKR